MATTGQPPGAEGLLGADVSEPECDGAWVHIRLLQGCPLPAPLPPSSPGEENVRETYPLQVSEERAFVAISSSLGLYAACSSAATGRARTPLPLPSQLRLSFHGVAGRKEVMGYMPESSLDASP